VSTTIGAPIRVPIRVVATEAGGPPALSVIAIDMEARPV